MSQFTDFQSSVLGKPIEVEDPSNLDQCFDLAFAWCDFIKVPRETIRHLRAFQIWTQPLDITLQYFDYIPNTPNGVPPEGAIIVFSDSVGVSGHVCIGTGKGDANGFTSLDQNWAGAQYAKLVDHVYTSVLGWLYRKSIPVQSVDPVILSQSDSFIAVCSELGTQATKDSAIAKIKGMNEQITTLEDNSQQLDRTNKDLLAQIAEVKNELATAQASNKTLQDNYSASQLSLKNDESKISALTNTVSELEAQIKTPTYTGFKKWLFDTFLK